MLTKRVIPCLDVKDGRVVKGVNFVSLRDAGDPVELARAYDEQKADEVIFLDTIQQQVQHLGGPGGVIRQRGVERAILINGLTILKPIDANHVGLFGILLQGFIQKVIRHARLRSFVARQSNRRGRVAQPSGHEKVCATCRLGNGLALVVLHPVGQRQHGLRVASACEMS